jgi:endonuclease V-like protein UPF0215 family
MIDVVTTGYRPHLLGIDDGPFDKRSDRRVPIVGVMMEGADLVEAVAVSDFELDGEDVSGFLAGWIDGLRFRPALHGVVLGGVTIAGLAVVEPALLAERLGLPVMVVNRQQPQDDPLLQALEAAGLPERTAAIERMPAAWRLGENLYVAHAGAERADVERMLAATLRKSQLPEPLRLAHLIAAAIARGESRGRP